MLNRLRRNGDEVRSVMLVGHNPVLQTLALQLAGSGAAADLDRLKTKLPTGALVTLLYRGKSWIELDPESCELHSVVQPREIGEHRGGRKRAKGQETDEDRCALERDPGRGLGGQ